MQGFSAEEIITTFVMSLWFLFPFGMFISVMRQTEEEKRPRYRKEDRALPKFSHALSQDESKSENYIYEDEDYDYDDDEEFVQDDFNHIHVRAHSPGTQSKEIGD